MKDDTIGEVHVGSTVYRFRRGNRINQCYEGLLLERFRWWEPSRLDVTGERVRAEGITYAYDGDEDEVVERVQGTVPAGLVEGVQILRYEVESSDHVLEGDLVDDLEDELLIFRTPDGVVLGGLVADHDDDAALDYYERRGVEISQQLPIYPIVLAVVAVVAVLVVVFY